MSEDPAFRYTRMFAVMREPSAVLHFQCDSAGAGQPRDGTAPDPLTDYFDPAQRVQCTQAGIRPSGPVATARAGDRAGDNASP